MKWRLIGPCGILGHLRWLLKQRGVREGLFQAEIEGRLRGPFTSPEFPHTSTFDITQARMTDIDEFRYRRIMAKLHYGEPTANPEYEALLTPQERNHLDAYLIHSRWADFLTREMRRGSGKQ
jgi:hypothetical protein